MVIGGQDTQRHPIGPVTDHLMDWQNARAGLKGNVYMPGSHQELGRSRVVPRGGLRGSLMNEKVQVWCAWNRGAN